MTHRFIKTALPALAALAATTPASAQVWSPERGLGDVIAGAVLGQVLGQRGYNDRYDQRYDPRYQNPYDRNRDGYDDRYQNRGRYGYDRYGNSQAAVNQCAAAVQQQLAYRGRQGRVERVGDVDRWSNNGFRVEGTVLTGGRYDNRYGNYGYGRRGYDDRYANYGRTERREFSCKVRYGRVEQVKIRGL